MAGALAMTGTILLLTLLDVVHPPAVSTALGFSFFRQQDRAIGFFVIVLVMVAALVSLQRGALWLLRRIEQSAAKRS